jgi:hypothetical protein
MGIVAVIALHQAFIDPVVKGLRKICLGLGMASIAQLRLVLDQQVQLIFTVLGVVRRMAVETADLATGVGGFRKM